MHNSSLSCASQEVMWKQPLAPLALSKSRFAVTHTAPELVHASQDADAESAMPHEWRMCSGEEKVETTEPKL